MKIHRGDKVKIIAGKDKGKEGVVLAVFTQKNKIMVEGINKAKRHIKPGKVSKEGGIISVERPIDVSNVLYIDQKTGKSVKIGYKIIDKRKYRISKKSGDVLDLEKKKVKS